MIEPINRFKITAMIGTELMLGFSFGAYSPGTFTAYSARTKVEEGFRGNGLGTELLRQKIDVFRDLGAQSVHSMIASQAGRNLVESQGFEFDENLTQWGLDEYYTLDISESL